MARKQVPTYEQQVRYPSFLNRATGARMPDATGWQKRHLDALRAPTMFEAPIVHMLVGWAQYADHHRERFESGIGDDGVFGPAWEAMGRTIHDLLDGDTGRLDCGTLSACIHDTLASEGFES